jgi:addiction module RelE/StbE family toxin
LKKLRWSSHAADDLEEIRRRIHEDNQKAAQQTVKAIYDNVLSLKTFPHRGRLSRDNTSRELVLAPLPYIVVYRVTPSHVEISRIWQGAQLKR